MKILSIFVIVIMTAGALFAQNNTVDSISESHQLKDVVVSAQFAPQSVSNTVYKVNVLHASMIKHSGSNNLSDLLQNEVNINLAQNSVFGSNVEMQGVAKENIKILIDGVPVIGRLNGIIDLSQINLTNIERVEIVEGPVSVFYGTDAMGGILNLVTKKNQKKNIEGQISAFYESIHASNLQGDMGFRFGKNLIRINAGYYQFDGLSTLDSVRSVNWPKRNNYFGDLMMSHDIGPLKLRYQGHLSSHALYTLGDPDRHGKIKDKNYFTRRLDNSLTLSGLILGDKYLNITASYLDYQRMHDTYDVEPATSTSVISERDTREKNIVKYNYEGFKASLGKSKNAALVNYILGIDANSEQSKGSRILDGKQAISTIALFGSLNYNLLNTIELQPGLRQTWNSAYGFLLSPAFNAKWQIADNHKLRFSYARGFRAPTIKELYLDFHISAGPTTFVISGNESLDVEKSHSFNLQYSWNAHLNNHSVLLVEPALFYNSISGLIDLSVLKDNMRHYLNIDKYKSMGGRIALSYLPSSNFVAKIGFGSIGRYNKFSDKNDSKEMLFSPEVSSSIRYSIANIGLHLNAFYKYTGKRQGFYYDRITKEVKETTKDDFSNLALTISKDFLNNKINFQIGGKNLFDVKDVEVTNSDGGTHSRNLQLWGRSFFAKATVKFGK